VDLGRRVDALAFLRGGARLVSMNGQTLTLWSVETGLEILSLPNRSVQARQFPVVVEELNRLESRWKTGFEK
jgi:hypothetical protein